MVSIVKARYPRSIVQSGRAKLEEIDRCHCTSALLLAAWFWEAFGGEYTMWFWYRDVESPVKNAVQ